MCQKARRLDFEAGFSEGGAHRYKVSPGSSQNEKNLSQLGTTIRSKTQMFIAPALLMACGLPRFARIDDRRSHLRAQECRLRHKRFPFTSRKLAVASSHLYPQPVSPRSRLLRLHALSAGR